MKPTRELLQKYPLKARVEFRTDHKACETFPKMLGKKGTVVGYPHEDGCIRVLVDGLKWPDTWSTLFWRKCE